MLKLYFDLNTGLLVPGVGVSGNVKAISFKRGDGLRLQINFLEGNVPATLPSAPMIQFGIKDAIDGTLMVFNEDFSEGLEAHIYEANVNTNTSALLTWVTGFTKRDGVAEITLSFDGGATWQSTSQELKATVLNDVLKGDETAPGELPTEEDWLNNRALRIDVDQGLDVSGKTQGLENLGLADDSSAGVKILFDATGHAWLALKNKTTGLFTPIQLDGTGDDERIVVISSAASPFV